MKDVLAIGIASFARTLTTSLAAIFVNRMCVVYGGDLAVSAYGVINRIMMFAIVPGITIGQGLQPVLGFNYGAGRYDRVLKVIKIATFTATMSTILVFFMLYFAPEPFIRIFTADTELIALGAYAARRIFLALYLVGFMVVGSLIFQSIGKVVQSLVTSVARTALFLIPLLFILPTFLQLDGVWLAFPVADALSFILIFVLLIPQMRAIRRLARTSSNL